MSFPTTSLFGRYEARLETGYSDADPLTTIVDQSPNGRDLSSPGGAERLTYKTGVLNGEPVFRADGGDAAWITAATGFGGTSSALTITFVGNRASEGSARSWAFALSGGNNSHILGVTEGATAGEWGAFCRTSTGSGSQVVQATSGVDTTTPAVLTLVWDGVDVALYLNGSLVSSDALGGTFFTETDDRIQVAELINVGENFVGDVALSAAWESALDATARADLHTYVQDTYGITVSDYAGGSSGPGSPLVGPSKLLRSPLLHSPLVR